MRTLMIVAGTVALLSAPAFAQTETKQPQAPSAQDSGSGQPGSDKKSAPKTTGAMNKTVGSVATSPQDVGAQQQGKKTAAEGGGDVPGASHSNANKSPKTTGAAPGADPR